MGIVVHINKTKHELEMPKNGHRAILTHEKILELAGLPVSRDYSMEYSDKDSNGFLGFGYELHLSDQREVYIQVKEKVKQSKPPRGEDEEWE